jgi:chloramphenicol-sensitive protein RarD
MPIPRVTLVTPPESHELGRGIRASLLAYALWGLLTIYWKQLNGFGAFELISWRIVTASIVMAAVVTVRHRWPAIRTAVRNRRLLARIAATAVLLTANWTAYVYAVVHDRVIETALGYFMAPLGTMILGITVLKERPTTAQRIAIGLAAAAVVELTASYGEPPIAALTMAVSWSVYGLLKRRVPLPAVDSFAVESFVLVVPAAVVLAAMSAASDSIPRTADAWHLTLASMSGVATAVPLVLFAFAAIRVPLTILGPLQYLVPTITFLLGWVLYNEELPWSRLVGFALVWTALLVVTVDGLRGTMAQRAASRFAAVSAD